MSRCARFVGDLFNACRGTFDVESTLRLCLHFPEWLERTVAIVNVVEVNGLISNSGWIDVVGDTKVMLLREGESRRCLVSSICLFVRVDCLSDRAILLLILMFLRLGASNVAYGHAQGRDDSIEQLTTNGMRKSSKCGGSGIAETIWATKGSLPTLQAWLDHAAYPEVSVCDGGKRTSTPTFAMDQHGSDKGTMGQSYTRLYSSLFRSWRCRARAILEVGIGSLNRNLPGSMWFSSFKGKLYSPGASLRGWRDVFPRANVTGLDVDPASMLYGARLETHVCNTLNSSEVRSILLGRAFDIIIDDGLHSPLAQRSTMRALWPNLQIGGIYVIEDINRAAVRQMVSAVESSVAVLPSHGDWALVSIKANNELPTPAVHISDLDHLYKGCWYDVPLGPEKCCGGAGVDTNMQDCFNEFFNLDCCIVYWLALGIVA